MKRLAVWGMAGALALMLTACGGNQAQPQQSAPTNNQPAAQQPSGGQAGGAAGGFDAAAAEAKFKQTCAACHGADLQGQVGPNLTKVGSKYSKEQILDILKNGKNSMPAGLVSGQDAENIAAWLAAKK